MKTKKIHIAIIIGIALGNTAPALAASGGCEATDCFSVSSTFDDTGNCANKTSHCYNGTRVYSCGRCNSGSTLKTKYTSVGDCQVEYDTCCSNTCSGCTSTGWTSASGGVEQQTTAICDCGTCRKTTSYRCAAGYYGSPTSASGGCTSCPSNGTSSAGSTRITDCYITGAFSDSTGSGTYTGSCYYSN